MFDRRTGWKLAKNAYTEALDRFRASGRELFDLTASNPTEVGLHYESERLLRALASPRALEYQPIPKGLLPAREAVAGYYSQKGIEISAEQVFVTVSTSEAYTYAFRLLCDPGDEVLVPQPSYPLFEFLADLQDVKLVPYELIYDHGWQIDFHSLECAIGSRTRAVLVVHPNNPTGSYVKQEEKDLLERLCSERELAIIADEVFLDYEISLEETPPPSPQQQSRRIGQGSFAGSTGALTFTLSGLSKISGLPQMKAAWIVLSGPERLAQEAAARLEVIADTYLSPNAPIQWAFPEMLESREGIQRQLRIRVEANLAFLDEQLRLQKMCHRLEVEGGWYVVLRVPVTKTDEELAIELLEQQSVLVQPGHFYDFASEGHLVVSLIAREEVFAAGVKKLLRCF
jgi:aspartate/methionine/tyrosine aminotransferase